MKIPITLDGQQLERDIPLHYGSVSFELWVKLQVADPIKRFAAVVDIDDKILRRAQIRNLDEVLHKLGFLDKPMNPYLPKEILGYKVPANLEFIQTGRYEDIQLTLKAATQSLPPEPTNSDIWKTYRNTYPELCAIAVMPDYIDASMDEQKEFIKQFWQAPCEEVVAIGNFSVLKLSELNASIKPSTLHQSTPLRKLLLAITSWLRSTAFSLRYASWKRKHRINVMSF